MSLNIIQLEQQQIARSRLSEMGFRVTMGDHVEESDLFSSSSVASRVADIHQAFRDPNVKAVLAIDGGFNSNQLLKYLDWQLIKDNPKIFCGYSDITALNNAIFAKTGLVTYSGPLFSSFGQKYGFEYTQDYFKKCLMSAEPIVIQSSQQWSDDDWASDQEARTFVPNEGFWLLQKGEASGTIIGANLCTLNLLQGTEYMPELTDSILFIEDDHESQAHHFDRDLQSLIHLPTFNQVKGIVIGRFETASHMNRQKLQQIISTKEELKDLPIIANADFGHSTPKFTFPIGGTAHLIVGDEIKLEITAH